VPREDEIKQKATLMAMEKKISPQGKVSKESQILVGGYL
jgi:hypothetical protein